jgi:acyl-coenzyme A thioesterase PaaI-like protein
MLAAPRTKRTRSEVTAAMSNDGAPVSAGRLAELLGDQLPVAGSVSPASIELVAAARRLVEAIVLTDVNEATRGEAVSRIDDITTLLSTRQRPDALYLVRHPDGRIESLMQAAAGRLNPQALPIEWLARPTEPPPGAPPVSVEVTARCTFTVAHAGSPGRVHGGVLAMALDEITGVAVRAAGASGMTVALEVSLRSGVPIGEPIEIKARYTGGEGRKAYATGEILVADTPAVTCRVIYVSEQR